MTLKITAITTTKIKWSFFCLLGCLLPKWIKMNKYSNKLGILETSVVWVFPSLYFKIYIIYKIYIIMYNIYFFFLSLANNHFLMLFSHFLFIHHNAASWCIWSVPDAQHLLRSSHKRKAVTARQFLFQVCKDFTDHAV